ncbi:hypothetical protein CBW56_14600 [Denitratisoma oestradiolicum]|nr:hypothetical protein CBW56_14600 [Denitratisoma oestradiolicum]
MADAIRARSRFPSWPRSFRCATREQQDDLWRISQCRGRGRPPRPHPQAAPPVAEEGAGFVRHRRRRPGGCRRSPGGRRKTFPGRTG